MNRSEIINHLGEERENYFYAVAPPIIRTSNFTFSDLDHLRQSYTDELKHHIYTRGNNPTVAILRQKLAALEKAEDALVFGSGSGAIAAAVIGNVQAGDHIVCVQSPYSWTYRLLTNFLSRFGVSHTFVDGTSIQAIEEAIQENTRVLFLESPCSITFELQDLRACADLAKRHQLVSIIDNSYSSPLFQNPISMGIDLVAHSASKYLNGHSDVVAGVLCGGQSMIQKIFESEQMTLGSIISPTDAALLIRGLRTLELRVQRSDVSARKVIAFLETHPKIEKVIYPFSDSFPQVALAKKQMSGCGGLFSFYLKAAHIDQAEKFYEQIQRFLLAVSWGGHESLILPFCGFYRVPGKADSTLPWNLVRMYIGLEDPEWLIEDLAQALEKM